ncbi:MAG TPA: hypothetical protein VF549_02070 [Solirubrobacteraceae bacterium]|jgi:hypothetical protein
MTVRLDVALVSEQGVRFAVVAVKRHVLDSQSEQQAVVSAVRAHLGRVPVVLMNQDSKGTPTYVGRRDLVRWLANSVFVEQLPWRRMALRDAA